MKCLGFEFFIISWVMGFSRFLEGFVLEPSEVSGVRHHSMTHCDCENWKLESFFFLGYREILIWGDVLLSL